MLKVTMLNVVDSIYREVLVASIRKDEKNLAHFWTGEEGNHNAVGTFYTDAGNEFSAAEEAFDLSNNPARESERLLVQAKTRSVSVGDVVKVEGNGNTRYMLCLNEGWLEL